MTAQQNADVAVVMHDRRGGGAERVTLTLAGAMADAGKTVDLVLFDRGGQYPIPEGVRPVFLDAPQVRRGVSTLAKFLRSTPPRALLSAMTHVNIATLLAVRLAGFRGRVVVVEHNTMSRKKEAAHRFAARTAYALAPLAYRNADVIAGVGDGVAADLEKVLHPRPGQVRALYNPVLDEAVVRRADEPVDDDWFAPGAPPVALGVGRLHAQKDFPTLIEAFARVLAKREARLLILGEGEERAALEAQIAKLGLAEHVRLPGFVGNPYAYYRRCGVFVLSSRMEGLPTVLIEAMACGAPIVSTDCESGPHEILGGGKYGALVGVGDVAALEDAIEAALADPRRCGPEATARYSVVTATQRYIEALGV